MISRRIRGLIGTTLIGSAAWSLLGVAVGIALQIRVFPNVDVFLSRPIPGGITVAAGLAGAIIGAINGLTFGGLLLTTERGKSLDRIRGWRFALVGATATAATLGLVFQNVFFGGIGGVLGALGGAGALWIARRAERASAANVVEREKEFQ